MLKHHSQAFVVCGKHRLASSPPTSLRIIQKARFPNRRIHNAGAGPFSFRVLALKPNLGSGMISFRDAGDCIQARRALHSLQQACRNNFSREPNRNSISVY
jgi:hypothetical protein